MIQHLFFDLDHTLWDFERNSEECLKAIYAQQLSAATPYDQFVSTFRVINRGLWRALEQNTITHDQLRKTRFKNTLEEIGITCTEEESLAMNEEFMRLLPTQTYLMEGARELLEYLHSKYRLHIISNGYIDIQTKKMKGSDIYHYFDQIVTSDIAQARKPSSEIFDFALQASGATRESSLYIGDDEIADKEGAFNAQFPFIHFNINAKSNTPTEIFDLLYLKNIL